MLVVFRLVLREIYWVVAMVGQVFCKFTASGTMVSYYVRGTCVYVTSHPVDVNINSGHRWQTCPSHIP